MRAYVSAFLFSVLVTAPACDSEEQRRAMMTEVATQTSDEALAKLADGRVAALEEQVAALTRQAEANAKRVETLTSLENTTDRLSAQLSDAGSRLAELEVDVEALQKTQAKPLAPNTLGNNGRPDPSVHYRVDLGDAHTLGPRDALVTIVTWSDFQCPFCNRVAPTIKELGGSYGKDLRYAFKHNPLPFHQNARGAAIAAEAAGEQGKFWEMHDKLFENQRSLTTDNFERWAADLGLDVKRFRLDLDSKKIAAKVDRNQQQATTLGARGTPSFFINGRFLAGAQPAAAFRRIIDEEMTKATALVGAGTPRSRVYAETVATGRATP